MWRLRQRKVFLGKSFFYAALDVVAGARVADHAGGDDSPERGVGLAITASVESVPLVLAAAGVEWGHATQVSEGGFASESFGVVAGRDEQSRRGVGAETRTGQQQRCGLCDQRGEDGVELGDLGFERDGSAR
jgi:hypothetical protein